MPAASENVNHPRSLDNRARALGSPRKTSPPAQFTPHFRLCAYLNDVRRAPELSTAARMLLGIALWSAGPRGHGQGAAAAEALFWCRVTGERSLCERMGSSYGGVRRALLELGDERGPYGVLLRRRTVHPGQPLPSGAKARAPVMVAYVDLDALRVALGLVKGDRISDPGGPGGAIACGFGSSDGNPDPYAREVKCGTEIMASPSMARPSQEPITDPESRRSPVIGSVYEILKDSAAGSGPPDLSLDRISMGSTDLQPQRSSRAMAAPVREDPAHPSPGRAVVGAGAAPESETETEQVVRAWWRARGQVRAASDLPVAVGHEATAVRKAVGEALRAGESVQRCLDALLAAQTEKLGGSSWRWLRDRPHLLDSVIWAPACLPRFAGAAQRARTMAPRPQAARQAAEGAPADPNPPTGTRSRGGDPATLERLGIRASYPGRVRGEDR